MQRVVVSIRPMRISSVGTSPLIAIHTPYTRVCIDHVFHCRHLFAFENSLIQCITVYHTHTHSHIYEKKYLLYIM